VSAAVNRAELTPVSFLERSGVAHAERIAVVDGEQSFTYRDWRERARRFAAALQSAGAGPGSRVAFLALNSEPLLLAHHAVPMAGAQLVAINTRLAKAEIEYILRHSGSRLLFVSPELRANVPDLEGMACIELGEEHEAFIASATPLEAPVAVADEYDAISVNYTSGTTGKPKGVIYHHRGAYLNAVAMALDHGVTADSTYLWTLPMFHCNGWCFPWATAAVGARNLCLARVDPERIHELCRAGEVTHMCGAPTVLVMLAESPAARRLERPVRIVTAGAPPSPAIILRMQELGFELDHVYGLTETYGPFTVNVESPALAGASAQERAERRARQGHPNVAAGELRVVADDGSDVPADGATMGEVLMRGNVVMSGYLDDPAATEQAFAGGWFHSGDVGVLHPDGQIELRDRKKDLIISGGENISTVEVEQVLASHPAVAECSIVAMPHERWGEVPLAFVTLRAGAEADERELIDHCRERLAHFKCPRGVVFGELPKTATGKTVKTELRERARSVATGGS
jgi:fatty-acyl-CoA synthase